MKQDKEIFDFGSFKVTRNEILVSGSIIAVMILIGILISGKISEYQMDKNEIYNKATKIESQDMFQYGMKTNVGNAFVYGDLKAVDTVTYPEIGGAYIYVRRDEEHYTEEVRTVYEYDDDGNVTGSHIETYWEWKEIGSEYVECKEISFCGINFASNKIDLPEAYYIDTIKESANVRYKYYGVSTEYSGTIFTDLRDNTISDNTSFYDNLTIEETVKKLESNFGIVIFWIVWIGLIGAVVYGFYYMDNRWLD